MENRSSHEHRQGVRHERDGPSLITRDSWAALIAINAGCAKCCAGSAIATVAAARTDVLARPVMGVERKRQTRDPKRAICSGRIRMQLYPYGGISLFAISAFNLHTPSDRILAGVWPMSAMSPGAGVDLTALDA